MSSRHTTVSTCHRNTELNCLTSSAGNQIGTAFWDNILQASFCTSMVWIVSVPFWTTLVYAFSRQTGPSLFRRDVESGKHIGNDQQQLDKVDVYFTEASNSKYVPRSIQVDLEPAVVDVVRSGPLANLFRPDTFVHGQSGAGNNWAKGYYTEGELMNDVQLIGAELIDPIMDVLRRQAENTDSFQGFQVLHSLGGGTGSGLGALLLGKIREEYPDRMLATFSIFPSPKVSNTVVEPYNAILSTHNLVENSNITCCIDNEALYQICVSELKQKTPEYRDLNALIAKVMSGFTTTLRFPGVLNSDLRKLAVNMVPFPRLHFFTVGYAPLVASGTKSFTATNVQELTAAIFQKKSLMAAIDPAMGKYLTVSVAYRGRLSMRDIEAAVWQFQDKNSAHFVPWIPNSSLTTLCTVPPVGGGAAAATLVANTTAISEVFKRSQGQFRQLFKRRAFTHWYTNEGMDETEFEEAENNLLDLCSQYDQYANAEIDEDGFENAGEMEEENVEYEES
ncbi:MAG: Tubulin beta chain (Beta tubulin) [Tremellales sp. Tagirdzhanova-0007]|nr:MAG: Tubulin beta chain (Beta tubulin) [Tremellales sp. Tagirdzhanova-0007]